MDAHTFTLTLSCPDRVGIVAAVSSFIASHCGLIVEANHYSDLENNRFFMRQRVVAETLSLGLEAFRENFSRIARQFEMDWHVNDDGVPKKMIVLASRQDHCLAELLYRWRNGEYNTEIPLVISNHEGLRGFVEWHQIAYRHVEVPAEPDARQAAFQQIDGLLAEHDPHLIVLARYMQVLPDWICQKYLGRIVNIHHSFLPSFSGARPYHQAHDKGVKLIGATCHYVTSELDEGPIIEQEVIRVDHNQTIRDMVRLGRDVEKIVLSRGVQYHLEDRVLLNGRKTVVFR